MSKISTKPKSKRNSPANPSVFRTLQPYRSIISLLAVVSVAANLLTLWLPKVISGAIDGFAKQTLILSDVALLFGAISLGIFILTYTQSIIQAIVSERVARDLRNQLAAKISQQSYAFVQSSDPSKLLTNLTSDMDSVKLFVSQAVVSLISSAVLIVGGSILLLSIDWRLGLAVLTIVPLIGITFFLTLRKVRTLFLEGRVVIDRLNRVITESVLGAAIIRVVFARGNEGEKFHVTNSASRDIGYRIVNLFAGLVPMITFFSNGATLIILLLGGAFVVNGTLSLGDFTAFSSYVAILIFPILVLGFVSNIIAQANASYGRIALVLDAPDVLEKGTLVSAINGDMRAKNINLSFGEKAALKDVSFTVKAGSRTAIIGPTSAGKSQLLYILTGLVVPTSGGVEIDSYDLTEFDPGSLHQQLGFVFQDSIIFNLSLRENIAFSPTADDEALRLAITTAELDDLVLSLPQGLDTIISERGTSLSGGQKQRLMLARALAIRPKILLLDDFTARVDTVTELKILANVRANYPDITLISVTQKIDPIRDYDQVLLLMEGELLATGTHDQLLASSPEYMQIYNSQRSTESYEV